jgi:hypothetical protein
MHVDIYVDMRMHLVLNVDIYVACFCRLCRHFHVLLSTFYVDINVDIKCRQNLE